MASRRSARRRRLLSPQLKKTLLWGAFLALNLANGLAYRWLYVRLVEHAEALENHKEAIEQLSSVVVTHLNSGKCSGGVREAF